MNAEYLLDAIGLLDDGLLREAEEYSRPRRDYRPWIGLAACLAVVLTLGYALTHIRMGGGAASGNGMSGGATGAPSASYGGDKEPPPEWAEGPDGSGQQNGGDWTEPQEPGMAVEAETLTVLIDGGLYRSTGEIIQISPEEGEVQYGLSWYDEESGEDRFEPRRWLMLEDGTVAVSWDTQEHGWLIFVPAEE